MADGPGPIPESLMCSNEVPARKPVKGEKGSSKEIRFPIYSSGSPKKKTRLSSVKGVGKFLVEKCGYKELDFLEAFKSGIKVH